MRLLSLQYLAQHITVSNSAVYHCSSHLMAKLHVKAFPHHRIRTSGSFWELHITQPHKGTTIASTGVELSHSYIFIPFNSSQNSTSEPHSDIWQGTGCDRHTLGPCYRIWNGIILGGDKEKAPLPLAAHTCPRNARDQYFSPLVQHPHRWFLIILKKEVLNCCAVQLNPEISSIKGKS